MSSTVETSVVSLPVSIDDVSTAWLSGALQSAFPGIGVTSFTVETVGTGIGLMGLLYRVTPEYDRPRADYPDSVIVKLPVLLDGTRQVAAAYRHYEKEVRFYGELARQTSVATAEVYFATHDVSTDNFVLVMEDLGHLRAEGIEYRDDDFWLDVRRSVLFCLFYPVQIMALDLTDPRAAALVREMAHRSIQAIIDLGALALLG